MKDDFLCAYTDETLKETMDFLIQKLHGVRALCRIAGINQAVYYKYLRQSQMGQTLTMTQSARKRLYEAALKVKAAEAEALKALKEEN